jgi:hypothetical protein
VEPGDTGVQGSLDGGCGVQDSSPGVTASQTVENENPMSKPVIAKVPVSNGVETRMPVPTGSPAIANAPVPKGVLTVIGVRTVLPAMTNAPVAQASW